MCLAPSHVKHKNNLFSMQDILYGVYTLSMPVLSLTYTYDIHVYTFDKLNIYIIYDKHIHWSGTSPNCTSLPADILDMNLSNTACVSGNSVVLYAIIAMRWRRGRAMSATKPWKQNDVHAISNAYSSIIIEYTMYIPCIYWIQTYSWCVCAYICYMRVIYMLYALDILVYC